MHALSLPLLRSPSLVANPLTHSLSLPLPPPQRYGRETQKTMCTDEAYHIDCKACRFCQDLIDSEADSVVEEEHEEEDVGTTNFDGTNGNMHGIFDSSMFVDGCNPKRCPEWDCRMWCHCFETNPNVELMFESVQYGESLARNCPEDDTACDWYASTKAARRFSLSLSLSLSECSLAHSSHLSLLTTQRSRVRRVCRDRCPYLADQRKRDASREALKGCFFLTYMVRRAPQIIQRGVPKFT